MLLRALRRLGSVRGGATAAVGVGLSAYCASRAGPPSLCDASSPKPGAADAPASGAGAPGAGGGALGPLGAAVTTAKETVHEYLIAPFTESRQKDLLPPLPTRLRGKELPTLVIALDDVLIHSTWDRQYGWRYVKRPGADEFLRALAPYYEIVVWTEQFSLMDTVIVALDKHHAIRHRLYKDGMVYRNGRYVKDLAHVNRDLAKTVVIDCSAANATQQPENYIIIPPYAPADAPPATPADAAARAAADETLLRHVPFLLNLARLAYLTGVDVREELKRYAGEDIPAKFGEELERLQKGGKRAAQPSGAPASTMTVWQRMRSSRASS
ncbi:hypothetical protein KFE25_005955 [Diacronema lutheri]|uniref:Mitochondrial import inner membrane translocase subunit TIM50 n=2 Tax=Diacronema lutheri TaxID=2081491 RepID=A0A8J5XX04_DIALT|nr:hypothetical protein KFE25_005955 [Diacronema lutheri]